MFLEFRDGSSFTQIVADKTHISQIWEVVESLPIESSVEVMGIVREHPKKKGVFEIGLKNLNVVSLAQEYPIGKKDHGPDLSLIYSWFYEIVGMTSLSLSFLTG